jgi:Ran GTPase-activating protein (RanGAP) involved in mRNA processing and transport
MCAMIRENQTMDTFNLRYCYESFDHEGKIGTIKMITEALQKSKTINWINLNGNFLTAKSMKYIVSMIENPKCILKYIDIGVNSFSKHSINRILLPSIRKNISLNFVDIYDNNIDEEYTDFFCKELEKEGSKNRKIEKLWKEYANDRKLLTNQQQKYLKGKPSNPKGINNANLPMELRMIIQDFIPKHISSFIDEFMSWIKTNKMRGKKKDKNFQKEMKQILVKLGKYKKTIMR